MKALVTGATGFIGSHLHRVLLARGWDVDVLLRASSDQTTLSVDARKLIHDGQVGSLLRLVAESKPDVVFHLASRFQDKHVPEDIAGLIDSNVTFPTQLLEAMVAAGCRNFINTGTAWEYVGPHNNSAVCLYAATKQAFAAVLRAYGDLYDVAATTLTLFDTYGPDDRRGKVLSLLARIARSGEELGMSPGEQLLDMVHVDDVADAFITAADQLMQGVAGSYAVSSAAPISLRGLAELVGRVMGTELKIAWGARPYRPREVMKPWNQGVAVPGWSPRIALENGLKELL